MIRDPRCVELVNADVIHCSQRQRGVHFARWWSISGGGQCRYWCDEHIPSWAFNLLTLTERQELSMRVGGAESYRRSAAVMA